MVLRTRVVRSVSETRCKYDSVSWFGIGEYFA